MSTPRVEINLNKIQKNSQYLVQKLRIKGINTIGVTKAVCGDPAIALAIIAGGVTGLADSRIENVIRMREAGIISDITMIRTPMSSQIQLIVDSCNFSYNTEISVIEALACTALKKGKIHNIVLMVEMGDLREGIMPSDLENTFKRIVQIPGINIKGIGANFACLNKAPPNQKSMSLFSNIIDKLKNKYEDNIRIISGGNSASLPWVFSNNNLNQINELRLGESILLGSDPISGNPIQGLYTDAFTLISEVIESKRKPEFIKTSSAKIISNHLKKNDQVILAIGNQDTDANSLVFPNGFTFVGATSDHLVLNTSNLKLSIGAECRMKMNYNSLMKVMNSPTVQKKYL